MFIVLFYKTEPILIYAYAHHICWIYIYIYIYLYLYILHIINTYIISIYMSSYI